ELHAAHFGPSQLTAVIVGDVAATHVIDVAASMFSGWTSRGVSAIDVPPPAPDATDRRRVVIPMMNKSQTEIVYGFTTIPRTDPRYYMFWLMNNVLGQYALGGRLGDSIRERQGMAYHVSSAFDANVAAGPLVIRAGVSGTNVDRAIASIDEEVTNICRNGVTPKELNESRQYL